MNYLTNKNLNQQQAYNQFENIKKYTGLSGKILNMFGLAVKVYDNDSKDVFYIKTNELVSALIGNNQPIVKKVKALISQRVLEIANPDTRVPVSCQKLQDVFKRFAQNQQTQAAGPNTGNQVLHYLEKLKLEMSDIPEIFYTDKLSEIAQHLQPGDFIVRKYHEDNHNLICDLQKFFHEDGYREAYKCSHIAIYLGEMQGEQWIAEAAMPHGDEHQVRRIKLDDDRFKCRPKNQYVIIRNISPGKESEKLVELAKQYTLKLHPETDRKPVAEDLEGGFKYNFFEAARSMWHSHDLGYFGRHRLFKYYSDYKNNIPFEYLGQDRKFFCSHFAVIMESLAEMNTSEKFQTMMQNHPIPTVYDKSKKGVPLAISKLWYSIRKGIWSRKMSYQFKDEIRKSLHTQLDALRTSPQNAVNYMMDDKSHFKVVALINHKGDL